jgi:hypothetical protein
MSQPDRNHTRPLLPARNVREAKPYLQAPFTVETIGLFARFHRRSREHAQIVFFVPVHQVKARLTHVFGFARWSPGEPSVLDTRSLSCSLIVLGKRYVAVGQGTDRLAQAANGIKHCALDLEVGAYLAEIEELSFPIGEREGEVPLGEDGKPTLTAAIEVISRARYARELARLEQHFGPPLEHTPAPWHHETPVSGRLRGLVSLTTELLARAERQPATPAALRGILAVLLTRSPGVAAHPGAQRTSAPGAGASDAPPCPVIEVDFEQIGPPPPPRRRAA